MKRKNILVLFVIMLISAIITLLVSFLLKEKIFIHRDCTVFTDWSQMYSKGYSFDGQRILSTEGDPFIYFYSDKNVYQVEVDVQMYSNTELLWNKDFYGEEVIYAELFWADENGEMNAQNSVPFKIKAGRDSYLLNVDCPAGTTYRLDIGDGVDVDFTAFSLAFNTYEECSQEEKVRYIIIMFILNSIVMFSGYIFCIRTKERN